MSCEICGRSSCTRSFHSLEAQEEFDTKTGRYATDEEQECRKCAGVMKEGTALLSTFVSGMPDFPGDTEGVTMHEGGQGVLVRCLKCEDCGYSVTIGE